MILLHVLNQGIWKPYLMSLNVVDKARRPVPLTVPMPLGNWNVLITILAIPLSRKRWKPSIGALPQVVDNVRHFGVIPVCLNKVREEWKIL
jgi:hypothetical protein